MGISRISLPPVIFGTSALGNLYVALDEEVKLGIVKESVQRSDGVVVFDSAGKYGAGLALETLGRCLQELKVDPGKVVISNKLGWLRTPLKTPEPTFEPGIWQNLKYDAKLSISYDGIIECFNQGNELLRGYTPQMVSVHDPDEYLATAKNEEHAVKLYQDILQAYKALNDLKQEHKVQAIGVGAKDWRVVQRIAGDVQLDWVMIANSMTVMEHPKELLDFIVTMAQKGVAVINSAVFHSGFLIGTDYYNYKLIKPDTSKSIALFNWRDAFFRVCKEYNVKPAAASAQFAYKVSGVSSIALNSTSRKMVKENLELLKHPISNSFWEALKQRGLIEPEFVM